MLAPADVLLPFGAVLLLCSSGPSWVSAFTFLLGDLLWFHPPNNPGHHIRWRDPRALCPLPHPFFHPFYLLFTPHPTSAYPWLGPPLSQSLLPHGIGAQAERRGASRLDVSIRAARIRKQLG